MEKVTTLFLKIAVILLGVPILLLCIFLVPELGKEAGKMPPEFAFFQYWVYIVFYGSTIPFYYALYQAFKLLRYIDKNKAFSDLSVAALKKIKYCAIMIACLHVLVFAALLYFCRTRRRPRGHLRRIGCSFCFNGDCRFCGCSAETPERGNRYQIRK